MTGWLGSPAHARWLEAEGDGLLDFGRASVHPDGGFAWLSEAGTPELDRPVPLAHPRHYSVKTTPAFVELKAELTEAVRAEVLAAQAAQGGAAG